MSRTFRLPLRGYLHDGLAIVRPLALITASLFAFLAWENGNLSALGPALLFVAAFTVVGVLLVVGVGAVVRWVRTVEVCPDGLTASTFFGRRRAVSWDEIEEVDVDSSGTPSYLALTIRGTRRRLYVPADLEHGRAFDALVLRSAGEGHPLADFLLPPEEADAEAS